MKFSLVVATYGRKKELNILFDSFDNQTYKNFEVIIIDQNEDDYVKRLYEEYKDKFIIKYIHSDEKGLSKARNKGLKYVDGDIIAFPDDDCEYKYNFLYDILDTFKNNENLNIVTCMSMDKEKDIMSNGKWLKKSVDINFMNVFKTAISYTIFIKYRNINDIVFDEKLGVGAAWGSGEETDMVLNLLHRNYIGLYNHRLVVYHPYKNVDINRAFNYALGYGALVKKEVFIRRNLVFILNVFKDILAKPIIGMLLSLITLNSYKGMIYKQNFCGRIYGFVSYR